MLTTFQEKLVLPATISARRVFIVGNDSLFEEGLANLLSSGTDLSISSTKYKDDHSLLEEIALYQPEVIVVNESMPHDSAHILDLIFSTTSVTAQYVMVVRLGSDIVDIHEMPKRVSVTRRAELVSVVRGDFNCVACEYFNDVLNSNGAFHKDQCYFTSSHCKTK